MTITDPTAGKPKLMATYRGLQVFDARENIRIILAEDAPRGLRAGLKAAHFKPASALTWERPMSSQAIFDAELVAKTFCEENDNG